MGGKHMRTTPRLSRARLAAMVEDATVDCHDEEEQLMGLFTMIQDSLAIPFETEVLGVRVIVEAVGLSGGGEIVVTCKRGRNQQAIPILELPLPSPAPAGCDWIEAYRHWAPGH